mmetsp:Transcript_16619/g.20382  ORF Transcript_16619/g.20382 Transcript_16619/m.20382 type:complete len:511 (-) Transcript_16619:617-2149(-)
MNKERFATLAITMYVDDYVNEDSLSEYLKGVSDARRSFKGYVSRKLIEIPCEDKRRLLLAVVKFSGNTNEDAYENMMRWERSEELASWIKKAKDIPGISTGYAEYQTDVGNISLKSKLSPSQSISKNQSPPLWKMSVLVEFWVFITEVLNYYAGTFPSMLQAFENTPFTLLVALTISVSVISYCALPLTLSIPVIARWSHRRYSMSLEEENDDELDNEHIKDDGKLESGHVVQDKSKKKQASCFDDVISILEDGFGMFADRRNKHLETRIACIERRLEMLSRCQKMSTTPKDNLINMINDDDPSSITSENEDIDGGICIAARHYVAWGCTREFEAWAQEMSDAMRNSGGFLGADYFRESKSNNVFVTLFRFQTVSQLRDWIESQARTELLAKVQPYTEAPTDYAVLGSGLRLWAEPFSMDTSTRAKRNLLGELLFHESSNPKQQHISPLYKTTILITLSLFFVVWIVSSHLSHTLHHRIPHPFLFIFCSTCITVVGNSYFGAPLLNFFFF